ncbi:hypothetical protein [Pseudomonas sp. PDM20]|nr:hypothetical protein [Pseudomonas sp. PDM20]
MADKFLRLRSLLEKLLSLQTPEARVELSSKFTQLRSPAFLEQE